MSPRVEGICLKPDPGTEVWVKPVNHQPVGAFKVGAASISSVGEGSAPSRRRVGSLKTAMRTEAVESVLAPEETEARLRAILEAALDCVITIDHEGRVLEFNRSSEQTFGFSRAEALGKPIADLIVPPRLRDAHRRGLGRYLDTGESRILGTRAEFPALCADGSELPVELTVTRVDLPGPPLFTASLRDISQRRRADDELRRSHELYRLVVLGSKDLIGLVGTDGRVVYASPSHEPKLGYRPESLTGAQLSAIVHPEDASAFGRAWSRALGGERAPFAGIRLRHADGSWRYLSGAASGIVGEGGSVSMVMITAHDVTDERDRDRARARREQAERDFVTNAAHDLRTPLAAITAALEVLQQGAKTIPEERDAFLADLEHETARLGRLMRALLELARVQAAGELPQRRPVRLQPLLAEIADSLRLHPGVGVFVECEHDLCALAAPDILERALANVGANAATNTAEGRIVLVARRLGNGGPIELEIADTGCGIAPDDLDHVFDRFYRAGDRNGDGFGLGLSIVREAVRVLGGTVHVESSLGVGTTVRLRLPAVDGNVVEGRLP